jgi:hypothetical protein
MGPYFTIVAGSRQRSHSQVRVTRDLWRHFTVYDSRLPQPGGPGPCIYILPEQGGPVLPPVTGFPFRRLLRLDRATVEVFDPASIRAQFSTSPNSSSIVASRIYRTDRVENTASHNSYSNVACYESVAAIA